MDNEQIEQRFKNFDSRLTVLEKREQHITQTLDSNTKILKKIERAISGESMSGAKGLVARMNKAEDDISMLKDFKNKLTWQITGAVAAVLVIFEVARTLIG